VKYSIQATSLSNKVINVDVQYKTVVNQLIDQIEMLSNCASRTQIFNNYINNTLQIIKSIQRLFLSCMQAIDLIFLLLLAAVNFSCQTNKCYLTVALIFLQDSHHLILSIGKHEYNSNHKHLSRYMDQSTRN